MFHHIVVLSFKQPLSAEDQTYIEGVCDDMARELPGIVSIRFVRNVSDRSPAYTHAFVVEFVDEAAHDNYQVAPIHLPLKEKIPQIADSVIVLDYET